MGKEVVAHEEAEEHEVVDDAFKVEWEVGWFDLFELELEVLSKNRDRNKLEFHNLCRLLRLPTVDLFVTSLSTLKAGSVFFWSWCLHSLSQNVEVGLVGGQTKHDQVRVRAVNTVALVGVVAGLIALRADKVQDFVFTLARHERV